MLTSLRHNLGGLLSFSGRTARRYFWPYAAVVIVLDIVAIYAVMLPMITDSFVRMQRFAAAHPDQVTITQGPGSYEMQVQGFHPELMPNFGGALLGVGAIALVSVVLLAAAVARRLHDRGKRGWWGTPPPILLATGLAMMAWLFDMNNLAEPNLAIFFLLFFNNLVYLASLAVLVVLLAGAGTPGANRYGDPPA